LQASIVGRRFGRTKWSQSGGKTVEGSLAFFGSVILSTVFLWAFGVIEDINVSQSSRSEGKMIADGGSLDLML
jgi:dolichol kinase